MFAKCTHIIVNLLKAWKVTVVRIDCEDAAFNVISRWSTTEIVLFRKHFFNILQAQWQTEL